MENERAATRTAFLVEPGFTRSVLLRNPLMRSTPRLLFYEDGTIRVEHKCKVIDEYQLIIAPKLQLDGGHRIVAHDPITVEPSIRCPDCGLHGFASEGRWEPV